MPSSKLSKKLAKRFMPLYLAAFSHGFVLWYPIEKIFMKEIGFNNASIGIMIAFYSAIMLLAETPSGILADRWSRKGVLILASIALALSALVGGISTNVPMYMLCAGLWGLFFALYSGTYESIVYDTILEEKEKSSKYEYYYGRVSAMDSAALVLGSIFGGLSANYLGLRYAYFISLPFSIFAIVALLRFKEPQLHKSEVFVPIRQHVARTFRAVLQKGQLMPIMIVLISASTLTYMTFEFSQLWIIALAAPLILFGPINALHLSTIGIAGFAAGRFKLHEYAKMLITLSLLALSSLGLIFIKNLPSAVISITLLCVCVIALRIIFTRLLHDSLSSKIRAGAASAVSTIGRAIIIPLSLIFGYLSEKTDIFNASWLLFGLVVTIIIFTIKTYAKNKELPNLTPGDELAIEPYNK